MNWKEYFSGEEVLTDERVPKELTAFAVVVVCLLGMVVVFCLALLVNDETLREQPKTSRLINKPQNTIIYTNNSRK